MPLRMVKLLRAVGWLAVAIIAVLSLVPGDLRPHTISSSQLEHVLAYSGTALVLALGYSGRWYATAIAVCLPAYAGLLEILQLWVPGRTSRVIDFVVGAIGTGIGILLAVLVHWSVVKFGLRERSLPPKAHDD